MACFDGCLGHLQRRPQTRSIPESKQLQEAFDGEVGDKSPASLKAFIEQQIEEKRRLEEEITKLEGRLAELDIQDELENHLKALDGTRTRIEEQLTQLLDRVDSLEHQTPDFSGLEPSPDEGGAPPRPRTAQDGLEGQLQDAHQRLRRAEERVQQLEGENDVLRAGGGWASMPKSGVPYAASAGGFGLASAASTAAYEAAPAGTRLLADAWRADALQQDASSEALRHAAGDADANATTARRPPPPTLTSPGGSLSNSLSASAATVPVLEEDTFLGLYNRMRRAQSSAPATDSTSRTYGSPPRSRQELPPPQTPPRQPPSSGDRGFGHSSPTSPPSSGKGDNAAIMGELEKLAKIWQESDANKRPSADASQPQRAQGATNLVRASFVESTITSAFSGPPPVDAGAVPAADFSATRGYEAESLAQPTSLATRAG